MVTFLYYRPINAKTLGPFIYHTKRGMEMVYCYLPKEIMFGVFVCQ